MRGYPFYVNKEKGEIDMNWLQLAEEVIEGKKITNDEAMAILTSDDDDLLKLLDGAFAIRKHYYGKKVKLNIGEPLDFSQYKTNKPEKEILDKVSKEIMDNIIMLTNEKK